MKKSIIRTALLLVSIGAMSVSSANWFGNKGNTGWGNFSGNQFTGSNRYKGYDDNDWPEWTPMYWMEEMFDDDDDRYRGRYRPAYPAPNANIYANPYASQYANPYGARSYANPYGAYANPYARTPYYANPYPRQYGRTPYPAYGAYPGGRSPYMFNPYQFRNGFNRSPVMPFAGSNSYVNPLSSFTRQYSNPFASRSPLPGFGGFSSPLTSPMGPMSPMGSMAPMSPLSPMAPFSPLSPMAPSMGTMGMPGMSPMPSMGGFGSPFGGSGFSPFR